MHAAADKAFATLLKNLNMTAAALLADQTLLDSVLEYHVLAGAAVMSFDLKPSQTVQTLLPGSAGKLTIKKSKSGVKLMTSSGGMAKVSAAGSQLPAFIPCPNAHHLTSTL